MSTQILVKPVSFGRRNLVFALFCLCVALSAYAPLRKLFEASLNWSNRDLSYIILIPFISGILIYSERRRIFPDPRTSIVHAAIAFGSGALLFFLGNGKMITLNENDQLAVTTAAVIAMLFSGFFLCYGAGTFKAALFPLLFLLLAIPLPTALLDAFTRSLQHGSAAMVSVLFAVTGTPAYRDGVSFALPGVTITVAEACSGIRSTLGMFIVTLLAGRLLLESNWKRVVLLLAVIPVSLFKNAVRIVTLTLLAVHYDMRFLTGNLHDDGGVVFMMIGLMILYPLLALLIRSEGNVTYGVQS